MSVEARTIELLESLVEEAKRTSSLLDGIDDMLMDIQVKLESLVSIKVDVEMIFKILAERAR